MAASARGGGFYEAAIEARSPGISPTSSKGKRDQDVRAANIAPVEMEGGGAMGTSGPLVLEGRRGRGRRGPAC